MKELPILYSTPMVQAILEDRKGMTRRITKPQIDLTDEEYWKMFINAKGELHAVAHWKSNGLPVSPGKSIKCPHGQSGDILWVRETWLKRVPRGDFGEYGYKADLKNAHSLIKWKPSIHMPKSAARIWLQVTDVRVERLQDITEEDAIAEGVEKIDDGPFPWKHYGSQYASCSDAVTSFRSLWQAINGDESWEATPWVWVISFKVLSTTGKPDLQTLKAIT